MAEDDEVGRLVRLVPPGADVETVRFIATWEAAESVSAVASALGMTRLEASNRASRLRGEGVGLKRFARTGAVAVTHEEFVRYYLLAESIQELVLALGLSRLAVIKRIRKLRAAGVRLPTLPGHPGVRGRPSFDLDPARLNAIIDEHAGGDDAEGGDDA